MKAFFRKAGIFLLLIMSGVVAADDEQGYRIAGIIASGATDWRAIVELPDGEQKLVTAGDSLGQIEIVRISKEGVTLQFPGGEKEMQLSQGGFIPLSVDAASEPSGFPVGQTGAATVDFSKRVKHLSSKGDYIPRSGDAVSTSSDVTEGSAGVVADDFRKLADKQLTSHQVASVTGLETLSSLSESARIVSFSYVGDSEAGNTLIDSVASGVNQLQKAIIDGKELRITVEGDSDYQDIYVMPRHEE